MSKVYKTSETLLFRVKNQRDDKSWNEFVGYYKNYIYIVARNMHLDHHDTEDILQGVLLKLWVKLPEFEYSTQKGTFRGYLCTIIRNMAIDLIKKKSRMMHDAEGDAKLELKKYIDQVALPEVEVIADKEWKLFLANTAWGNVEKEISGKVLETYLLLLKGVSLDKVAEIVGIQKNTVYVYKLRVMEKIKKEISRLEWDLSELK